MIKLKNLLVDVFYKDYRDDAENNKNHGNALRKTGFWGNKGAGAIILAKSTGRILLQLRSNKVEEPYTWGVWGGAIDANENTKEAMIRELEEETGIQSSEILDSVLLYIYKHPSGFEYYNYLVLVNDEFTPNEEDNAEWADYDWFNYGHWPKPLHFGLKYLLQHADGKIKDIINNNK